MKPFFLPVILHLFLLCGTGMCEANEMDANPWAKCVDLVQTNFPGVMKTSASQIVFACKYVDNFGRSCVRRTFNHFRSLKDVEIVNAVTSCTWVHTQASLECVNEVFQDYDHSDWSHLIVNCGKHAQDREIAEN